ncbi:MAG: PaaI family thioesterase [Acidimicrobiales bacterium]
MADDQTRRTSGPDGPIPWGEIELPVPLLEVPLHQMLGLRVVQLDDPVIVEMPVAAGSLNSSGNLHGGAIATLIDVAGGTAAARGSTFEPGRNTIVTADLHVRYLARPRTATVRAEARLVRAGRQLVVVECRVLDGEDRVLAVADFSSMVVPLRQPLEFEGSRPGTGDIRQPDL